MHVSKIEVSTITEAQVDIFYHHLLEIFPSRAEALLDYMNEMLVDNEPPAVQWLNLLTFTFDWAFYGN